MVSQAFTGEDQVLVAHRLAHRRREPHGLGGHLVERLQHGGGAAHRRGGGGGGLAAASGFAALVGVSSAVWLLTAVGGVAAGGVAGSGGGSITGTPGQAEPDRRPSRRPRGRLHWSEPIRSNRRPALATPPARTRAASRPRRHQSGASTPHSRFGAGFGIMWWYLARSSSLLFFLPVYLIVSFLGAGLTRVLTK